MDKFDIKTILCDWSEELAIAFSNSASIFVAVFSTEKELLYANHNFLQLTKSNPAESLINPTFDKLLTMDTEKTQVFSGYLTIGDYEELNHSILANIYRKEHQILIIGGVDAQQLLAQNENMHRLNNEISLLQRELIKEKRELENTNEELTVINNELDKADTNKDRFIAILAHDLKGPFGSILGLLNLLSKNFDNYDIEKTKQYIEMIFQSSKNIFNLLEDLLTWTQAQSSTFPFKPEVLNLNSIVDEISEITEAARVGKNITLHVDIITDIKIYADQYMIKTVLRNLISNAIKFTNPNGMVHVSSKCESSFVAISVSDNGVGMDEKTLAELFDLSKKFTSRGTAGEHGTGLGLLLCKDFIEKHGGQITAISEPEKGSQLTFTIPHKFNYSTSNNRSLEF